MIERSLKNKNSINARFQRWVAKSQDVVQHRFLSAAELKCQLLKERERADRREIEFCVIVFHLTNADAFQDAKPLIHKVLSSRLRITDDFGFLDESTLMLLLPDTPLDGARHLAEQLKEMLEESLNGLSHEVLSYPDEPADEDNDSEGNGKAHQVDFARENTNGQHISKVSKPHISFAERMPLWKRTFDISASLLGLVILSPLLAIVAILVKLNSPGSVIFSQLREGKDGKIIKIYKFRTMFSGAEAQKQQLQSLNEQDGPAFKIKEDPRLTSLGKYLRKSCIDELPQLVNVLRGDMTIVGPRPLPLNESGACKLWQRKRLDVEPGLTCFWQAKGDRYTPFDEWMRLDLEYVRKRSFWTDCKLILQTFKVVVQHRGSV